MKERRKEQRGIDDLRENERFLLSTVINVWRLFCMFVFVFTGRKEQLNPMHVFVVQLETNMKVKVHTFAGKFG